MPLQRDSLRAEEMTTDVPVSSRVSMNKFSVFVSWLDVLGRRFSSRPCPTGLTTIFITLLLVISGCATNRAQQQAQQAPARASATVSALYNEAAAFFQQEDFERALEKYRAALEQARITQDSPGIGLSLGGIGVTHQALKEYSQALDSYTAALSYFRNSQNLAAEGLTLVAIGEVQVQQGNDAMAIEAFAQALAVGENLLAKATDQEKILILPYRANVLSQKAAAHRRLKQTEEAVGAYEAAAVDFRALGKLNLVGVALWEAAYVRLQAGTPEQAEKLYSDAFPIFQNLGEVKNATSVQLGIGMSQIDAGKNSDAVKTLTGVVETAEREGFSELLTDAYGQLAQAFEGLGEFGQALRNHGAFIQRLRVSDRNNKLADESTALVRMGKIYHGLSQYEKAIEHFRLALVNYRRTKDVKGEANALVQLGDVFGWLGDFKTASQYYKQALGAYKATGNAQKQIEILASLALVTWRVGGPEDDVVRYLREAENLHESLIKETGVDLSILWKKKLAITEAGYDAEDIRYANEFQKQQGMSKYYLPPAAQVHRLMRESKQFFKEWQDLLPSLGEEYLSAVGTLFQKWGFLLLLTGETKDALNLLIQANFYHTSIPSNREVAFQWAKDWYYMAEAYRRLGDVNAASFYFDMVYVLASNLQTLEIHWVYAGKARTLVDMGQPEEASRIYKAGLQIFESVQGQQETEEVRSVILEGASYVYRDFVALLLSMYEKDGQGSVLQDAFEYTEAGRARAFLAMLGKSRVTRLSRETGVSADDETVRNQIVQVQYRLQSSKLESAEEAILLKRLEELRKSWQDIQRQTAQNNPQYSQLLFPEVATASQVQAILGADTAFLEYAQSPDGATLWVITQDQVRVYRGMADQNTKSILEDYIKTLREPLMGASEMRRHAALGKQLYQILLGPAQDQFRGKKHLIIAPDGLLYYLPFEALIISPTKDTTPDPKSLADNHYLIRDYTVNYIPSASVLVSQWNAQRIRNRTAQLPLLAFGDPVYSVEKLPSEEDVPSTQVANMVLRGLDLKPLKFSREEVLRIARVFDVAPTSDHVNLRERATVQRLRELDLSRYTILHFATHGILSDEVSRVSQPALVLSQSGKNDSSNLLQFSDILQMKLNAELVVLSACETGLGRLREGEGIVGLTRAFLYAGASSTVVSLWKVEDQSTSLLMEHFYKNLKRGLSKAEALRQAKLDMIRSSVDLKATATRQSLAAPFYWAPFILVGDWGPIHTN
jgi:CHAT domain-containing protein